MEIGDDTLVEMNPEWIKLISQIKTRSKSRKAKEESGNIGGVMNGGINKK